MADEGDPCRGYSPDDDTVRCDGELVVLPGRDCCCHISPPCGSCVETSLRCSVCDLTPVEAEA
jgi:hypothetical protein